MKRLLMFTSIFLFVGFSCQTQDNTALLKSIGEAVIALDSSFEQRGDFQDSLAVETLNVLTEITQRLEKNIVLKDSIEWNIEQRDSIEWEIDYRDTTIYDTNRVEIPDTTWKPVILFTVSPKDTTAEGGKNIVITWQAPPDSDLAGYNVKISKNTDVILDVGNVTVWEHTLLDTGLHEISVNAYDFSWNVSVWSEPCCYNCIGE